MLISLTFAIIDKFDGGFDYAGDITVLLFVSFLLLGALPFFITAIVSKHPFRKAFPQNKRQRKRNAQDMDYIQSPEKRRARYLFIVKDNQFGLYDLRKLRIQIPAVYDQLWWQTEGAVLMGIKNGRNVLLDIYGHELH